jgi:hypothetical protein
MSSGHDDLLLLLLLDLPSKYIFSLVSIRFDT